MKKAALVLGVAHLIWKDTGRVPNFERSDTCMAPQVLPKAVLDLTGDVFDVDEEESYKQDYFAVDENLSEQWLGKLFLRKGARDQQRPS